MVLTEKALISIVEQIKKAQLFLLTFSILVVSVILTPQSKKVENALEELEILNRFGVVSRTPITDEELMPSDYTKRRNIIETKLIKNGVRFDFDLIVEWLVKNSRTKVNPQERELLRILSELDMYEDNEIYREEFLSRFFESEKVQKVASVGSVMLRDSWHRYLFN